MRARAPSPFQTMPAGDGPQPGRHERLSPRAGGRRISLHPGARGDWMEPATPAGNRGRACPPRRLGCRRPGRSAREPSPLARIWPIVDNPHGLGDRACCRRGGGRWTSASRPMARMGHLDGWGGRLHRGALMRKRDELVGVGSRGYTMFARPLSRSTATWPNWWPGDRNLGAWPGQRAAGRGQGIPAIPATLTGAMSAAAGPDTVIDCTVDATHHHDILGARPLSRCDQRKADDHHLRKRARPPGSGAPERRTSAPASTRVTVFRGDVDRLLRQGMVGR